MSLNDISRTFYSTEAGRIYILLKHAKNILQDRSPNKPQQNYLSDLLGDPRFSQIFWMDATAHTPYFPLGVVVVGRIFRLYVFSPFYRDRLTSASLPLNFPRVVLIVQLCVLSLSPAESSQLSACAHWPPAKAHTLCLWGRTQGAGYGGCTVRHTDHWEVP